MKLTILILLSVMLCLGAVAQKVPSFCTADSSILAKYKDDADRLALNMIYRNNLSLTDSIIIPQKHSEIVLKALIAVYNATSLPARDSVVELFDIHTFLNPVMNSIYLEADSGLSWMHQLRSGHIPTGNPAIDSILANYQLSFDQYYDHFDLSRWHSVIFKSNRNYNLPPMASLFKAIPGVWFSDPNSFIGDGNNIKDSVYTDHVELVYSIGLGDCPCGCTQRHYWKFNVYNDCSVEYAGSYGNDLYKNNITVGPNPFINTVFIRGLSQPFNYSLSDLNACVLMSGQSSADRISNLDKLTPGLYILTIQANNQTLKFKIIRR